jgi:hypothetical protein
MSVIVFTNKTEIEKETKQKNIKNSAGGWVIA